MKRSRLLAVVAGVAVVGVAVAAWVALAGRSNGGTEAAAAEPKADAKAEDSTASVSAVERGPMRTDKEKNHVYWSDRITSPALPAPVFRIHMQSNATGNEYVFSDVDVTGLLKLTEKLKGQKQSDAEVVRETTVFWAAGKCQLRRLVGDNESWKMVDGKETAPSLEMFAQMLKDVEALKVATPSVKW